MCGRFKRCLCSHLHSEKWFDLDGDENCEDNSNMVSEPKQKRKTKIAKYPTSWVENWNTQDLVELEDKYVQHHCDEVHRALENNECSKTQPMHTAGPECKHFSVWDSKSAKSYNPIPFDKMCKICRMCKIIKSKRRGGESSVQEAIEQYFEHCCTVQ